MTQPHPDSTPTPAEARAALEKHERLDPLGAADTRALATGLAGVGIAMALVLVLVRLTIGNGDLPTSIRGAGFAIGMLLYGVAIGLFTRQMSRVKASPRGFKATYTSSFAITVVLYTGSVVALSTASGRGETWAWWVVAVAVVATAVPALIGAFRIVKLGRR